MALGVGLGAGLSDLVGGIINLADPDKGGKKYAKQALELWRALQEPQYSEEVIPWQQLLLQGELSPETYEAIIGGPVAQISEDPALRESQLRSLLGMEQVAREGLPLQDRLLADEAQRSVAGEFGRANESILRNLAARGRAGGGTELAARMQASGAGAELARGMGSDLAMQAIQNRLMGLGESSRMAGEVRGMDAETAALNAQMQNRYNEIFSAMRTQAAENAARQRQQAQLYNLGQRQRLHEANVLGGYQSRLGERGRLDDLQDRLFSARMNKIQGQTGALGEVSRQQMAREMAKQQNVRSTAGGVGSILDSILQAKGGMGGAGGAGGGGDPYALGYTTADDYRLASYR